MNKTQIIVSIIFSLIVSGATGYIAYRLDKRGYDRCETKYTAAAQAQKETSRTGIIQTEKKYDKIQNILARTLGPDDPVGLRVELSIDSMPDPDRR
ncbi:MAG: hypothetical protein JWO78_220 [Micavibrio sp.]|nr:hypothetical protein [Micavibrio sp.]